MILQGKGYFTWILSRTEGGNPAAIASMARAANFTHVLVKISDGAGPFNIDYTNGIDYAMLVTNALKSAGIQVWGWHYIYGDSPINEANQAISRIRQLNVDGYVINAEVEYKRPNRRVAARTFMERLRSAFPNLPVGLSSYRYPSYHPELPWREFLEYSDIAMPQVYWMRATNAGQQLQRSVREYQAMIPYRPIIPTGAAFAEHGWRPYLPQVLDFLNTAKSLNLKAVNFWEWFNTRTRLPEIWEGIREYPWDTPALKDIAERYIETLNTRSPRRMADLYAENAVHITSARTIQGRTSIRNWYQSLFSQILPNASFTLTGFSGTGSSRHVTWTAVSSSGRVQNGNDTLGILNDRIMYHYTFFTVTS